MMWHLAMALATAFLLGLALVAVLVRAPRPWAECPLAHLWLAVGAGISVSSAIFFLWLLVAGAAGRGVMVVEVLLLVVFAAVLVRRLVGAGTAPWREFAATLGKRRPTWVGTVLFLGFSTALAPACATLYVASRISPHGYWDAWAIWNARARFLFLAGDQWNATFAHTMHSDYPLLLPTSVARCWTLAGALSQGAPIALAAIFTLGTIGLLTAAVAALRDARRGLLAGLCLLGAAGFLTWGNRQYADVPLAFFMLAAVASVLFYHRWQNRGYLLLAGLTAGAAAWTKNEGILFLLALLLSRATVLLLTKRVKAALYEAVWLLAGATPMLACVGMFKVHCAYASVYFSKSTEGPRVTPFAPERNDAPLSSKLLDGDRYALIAQSLGAELAGVGGWRNSLGLVPLAICAALLGVRLPRRDWSMVASLSLALLVLLGGYFCVFLITPNDLAWHLGTACDRLCLHVVPSLLLLAFMAIDMPGGAAKVSQAKTARGAKNIATWSAGGARHGRLKRRRQG